MRALLCWALLVIAALGPTASASEVRMVVSGGVYTVPVTVNGQYTLDFVVDSGAADVSLPMGIVQALMASGSLQKSDFLPGQVYQLADGSTHWGFRFILRDVRIGGLHFSNVVASASEGAGTLLLGQSLLSRLPSWSIDNKRHVLVLGPTKPPASKPANTKPKRVLDTRAPADDDATNSWWKIPSNPKILFAIGVVILTALFSALWDWLTDSKKKNAPVVQHIQIDRPPTQKRTTPWALTPFDENDAITDGILNTLNFSGRMRRSHFWIYYGLLIEQHLNALEGFLFLDVDLVDGQTRKLLKELKLRLL